MQAGRTVSGPFRLLVTAAALSTENHIEPLVDTICEIIASSCCHDFATSISGDYGMIIPVVYENNKYSVVYSGSLDKLIIDKKIISFRRSCEWVIIGKEPIRSNDNSIEYNGPERRLRINNLSSIEQILDYNNNLFFHVSPE